MTILITGAGLVGTHVAQLVQGSGEPLVLVDVDIDEARLARKLDLDRLSLARAHLSDLPTLLRLVREHAVDRIVHTASLTSITWTQPSRGVTENVTAILNLLEAASLEGVSKVVFASSSSVYGLAARGRTDALSEDVTPRPVDVYGITKLTGELLGTVYGRDRGFAFSTVRYPLVVPPVEPEFQRVPHTAVTRVGSAISNMVRSAVTRTPLVVDDWAPLDWIYVRDAAAGTLRTLAADAPTGTYNLTAGSPLTLADVAAAIRKQIPDADIEVRPAVGGSVMQRVLGSGAEETKEPPLDGGRAARELGFSCAYDVAGMVEHMIVEARELLGA